MHNTRIEAGVICAEEATSEDNILDWMMRHTTHTKEESMHVDLSLMKIEESSLDKSCHV